MSQAVGDGPAAHSGLVDLKAQTAMNFRGGQAVRSRRTGRKEFAHECFRALRPIRRVIAARMTRSPAVLLTPGGGTEIIGVKFVETGAAQSEFFGCQSCGQFAAPKGGEDFTN